MREVAAFYWSVRRRPRERAEEVPAIGGFALFALGIVSSGLLAIPVMAASSGYAVCGAFKSPRSLTNTLAQNPQFYGTIAFSCFVGLLVNAFGISPFRLLYYSGVLNGVISPVMLLIVTHISANRRIMGQYVNPWWTNAVGYGLAGGMALALIAFFVLSRNAS